MRSVAILDIFLLPDGTIGHRIWTCHFEEEVVPFPACVPWPSLLVPQPRAIDRVVGAGASAEHPVVQEAAGQKAFVPAVAEHPGFRAVAEHPRDAERPGVLAEPPGVWISGGCRLSG